MSDRALGFETGQCVFDELGLQVECGAELRARHWALSLVKDAQDGGFEIAARFMLRLLGSSAAGDAEMEFVLISGEREADLRRGSGGAVLDFKQEAIVMAAQVE